MNYFMDDVIFIFKKIVHKQSIVQSNDNPSFHPFYIPDLNGSVMKFGSFLFLLVIINFNLSLIPQHFTFLFRKKKLISKKLGERWALYEWTRFSFHEVWDEGDRSSKPNLIWEVCSSPFKFIPLFHFCFLLLLLRLCFLFFL